MPRVSESRVGRRKECLNELRYQNLVGEEIYAAGAYVNAGPMHAASLQAQDVLRWLLVAVILGGTILKLLGLDQIITDFFGGLL